MSGVSGIGAQHFGGNERSCSTAEVKMVVKQSAHTAWAQERVIRVGSRLDGASRQMLQRGPGAAFTASVVMVVAGALLMRLV